MRWFKHMSDMLDDPWVQDVFMAEHGLAGYGFLCGIFEIYAKTCKDQPGEWTTIPTSCVTRKLRLSEAKVDRWLNECATVGKLSYSKDLRTLCIKIQKMQELRDEWTERKNKNSGVTPEQLTEQNTEAEEEEDTPLTPPGGSERFSEFWSVYPKRVAKAAAKRHWGRHKLDKLADQIIAAVKRYKTTEMWLKDKGKYIPNPLTFLNQGRWDDEIDSLASEKKPHWQKLLDAESFYDVARPGTVYPAKDYTYEAKGYLGVSEGFRHKVTGQVIAIANLKPTEKPA